MKVIGLAGYSGAGKTALIERLIPALQARGQRVSVVKHAHHGFDIDHPGKDTFRHREAGAFEVVVASDQRLALLREFEQPTELTVHQMIRELSPTVDWVLVEGFRDGDLQKIEVWRHLSGKAARYMDDKLIVAVATDSPEALPQVTQRPVLNLNDVDQVADWLQANRDQFDYRPEIAQ